MLFTAAAPQRLQVLLGSFIFVFKPNDHYWLSGVLGGRKTELMTGGNLFVLPVLALDAGGGTDQVLDHVMIDGQRESRRHAAR